jgi:integrase
MKLYRQKKSKYWSFDHTFPDGTRIRQSTRKTDKQIARMWATEIIREKENEQTLLKKGSFMAEYLPFARARKTPKAVSGEIQRWKIFTTYIGNDEPWSITLQQADKFITHLLEERKLRPSTINGYIRTLRMLYNKAARWKFALANPFTDVQKLSFEPELPRFLTQEELNKFFLHAKKLHPHLVPLFAFYFLTGLRRSEAFKLTWNEVDLNRKLLTIIRTKGKRPRFVPITPMAEKILLERKDTPTPFAYELDREIAAGFRPLDRISKAAGIPHVTLHDLRRTFATYMAEHLSEKILQQLLGHENYSVTDIFYIGTNAEALRKKMIVLDEMLTQALTYKGMPQLKIMT